MASVSRETMEMPTSKPIGGHSTFMNGYPLAGSYRFGQLQPHFVQEVVPDDDITLSTAFKLDSYTLSQPLMQDLFITHGYYFVPLSALLPLNYEKFITNPNLGDDVNSELVGLSYDFTSLTSYFGRLYEHISAEFADLDPEAISEDDLSNIYVYILKYVLAWDMIFGLGGLPATLGYKFISPSIQKLFEDFLSSWRSIVEFSALLNLPAQNTPSFTDLHQLIEFVRDDFASIDSIYFTFDDNEVAYNFVSDFLSLFTSGLGGIAPSNGWFPRLVNMSRILGYQVSCAHFFTNDKIDYVYSAELYRQNIHGLFHDELGIPDQFFTYNGVSYLYDTLSSYYFSYVLNVVASIGDFTSGFQYLRLLFGFNYSLRHVDYFTGSRTRPLAVGNVGVNVNNNVVDVVETIQTTWFAKFLNQVNRTGRRMSNYIKGLFPSTAIAQDWHEPIWLGDVTDKVGSSEVENTGVAQQSEKNSITSTLASNANKYGFRYHNTQYYGVIIGLCYFDIERFYPEVTERPIYHVDRFDMFNPFLQFNGDQEVYGNELQVMKPDTDTFGYQSRYLEYKQRVPQCFGAFEVDPVLSKSIFIADSEKKDIASYNFDHISPSYIRSHPLEFDKFYLSLTGLSLAYYYHFQIIHWNRVKSVRPMVFNPQLG